MSLANVRGGAAGGWGRVVSPDVKAEAAQLVDAAAVFWPKDRLAAVRMAKDGVAASGRLGHRSPERCRLLLEQLDVVAEMTPEEVGTDG